MVSKRGLRCQEERGRLSADRVQSKQPHILTCSHVELLVVGTYSMATGDGGTEVGWSGRLETTRHTYWVRCDCFVLFASTVPFFLPSLASLHMGCCIYGWRLGLSASRNRSHSLLPGWLLGKPS
jgi:hypothetical protein